MDIRECTSRIKLLLMDVRRAEAWWTARAEDRPVDYTPDVGFRFCSS
jgi:hypothetical protein